MIKGLSETDKYRVVRPIIGGCELDEQDMPIIHKLSLNSINWENLIITGFKNISTRRDNTCTLAQMFSYDKALMPLWNNPLKRVPLFQTCAAVATPDFSIYESMNTNEIRHNIYMARWLGCTWQNYGCKVIPTVGWAARKTYDICFSGLERGTPVIISTLGCKDKAEAFLAGFNEMRQRIAPAMIIVYGDMIRGMTGTFIHFNYRDSFVSDAHQLRMDEVSQIITIKEVA